MLFGVSYYNEYLPIELADERLEVDLSLMREAHLNVVRIGDGIWARCEPVEGQFDLDWFGEIIDAIAAAGLKIILCTPTYAIPPWLARRRPEVMGDSAGERRAGYGARQNMDFSHPAYRFYAERITRMVLARYADHPAVIGFQVDNETGTNVIQNASVQQAFRDQLRQRFGTVERLNELWGLNFWSHRLGSWDDLWPPEPVSARAPGPWSGNTNPGYDLEWRRFHARLTTEFLAWLVGIVGDYARPDQFVTQDIVGGHGRSDADRHQVAALMDVSSENLQHGAQDDLAHPPGQRSVIDQSLWAAYGPGAYSLYLKGDLGWGSKRTNFLVTEFNASGPGGSANTFPAYDGQWRAAAYATVARGANMIMYWHWHSTHHGYESHVGGILNHAFRPTRAYREIARLGAELTDHGELLTGLTPDADVGFLYSTDSRYAMAFMPPLKQADSSAPDRLSYERIFNTFYSAFFDARAQAAVIDPGQRFEDYPVLVVPGLFIATDDLLSRLVRYAENGGHLVLSFRSGVADEYARIRWTDALEPALGARYDLVSNLAEPIQLRSSGGEFDLPDDAAGHAWADELEADDATVLAEYVHPHFGRYAAAVSRIVGQGRISYVGTLPNRSFGQSFASWACDISGIPRIGAGLPEPIRVTSAQTRSGEQVIFAINWSHTRLRIDSPWSGRDLITGRPITQGAAVELGPWDVLMVVSTASKINSQSSASMS